MGNEQRLPALEVDATAELVATERAGKVAWALAGGRSLSTQDIAAMTGLSVSGAWKMMYRLSRALPLSYYAGQWQSALSVIDGFEGDLPQR